MPVFFAPHLRLFYALFFFITAFSFNYWYFLLSAFMLNLIHSFSIPFWQDCFQRYSPSSEWKVVGTSRKTLVAISGILGSFLGGYFIGTYNIMFTYIFAAILCALSSVFLVIFVRKSYEIKENIWCYRGWGGERCLCAAIAARQKGKSVLVVEKSTKIHRGGNSSLTMNFRFSHTNFE